MINRAIDSVPCAKCGGTKRYQYDHNHWTVCNACCQHEGGWWLLEKYYGEDNGKWCCLTGCGKTVKEKP